MNAPERETMEVDSKHMDRPRGIELNGGFTGEHRNQGGDRLVLTNTSLEMGHVIGERRNPPTQQEAGSLAEIRLSTDGRRWLEEDGPTALWSAFGTWPGLVLFFPALPESGKAGS